MEHCFRTALWILVLIGCLQAAPLKKDYRFELLRAIPCNGNKTFKSPNSASDSCLAAAVETIKSELNSTLKICKCTPCADALDALDALDVKVPSPAHNSTECMREQEGSLTFDIFLKEFESVIERIANLPKH